MTLAVCLKCGSIKYGAFASCEACHAQPASETDLAYSLALTDHHFSYDVLNQISRSMRSGKLVPSMVPEQEEQFRIAAREYMRMRGQTRAKIRENLPVGSSFQPRISAKRRYILPYVWLAALLLAAMAAVGVLRLF